MSRRMVSVCFGYFSGLFAKASVHLLHYDSRHAIAYPNNLDSRQQESARPLPYATIDEPSEWKVDKRKQELRDRGALCRRHVNRPHNFCHKMKYSEISSAP